MNGSPLFTGDAGSGESEIRRFILEQNLLDSLIALPEQLFYNTGIATYIWVVTNRKAPAHRGTVQLRGRLGLLGPNAQEPWRQASGDPPRQGPGDSCACHESARRRKRAVWRRTVWPRMWS